MFTSDALIQDCIAWYVIQNLTAGDIARPLHNLHL